MSFTSETKKELCRIVNKRSCCEKAECYGIWLFSKCLSLKQTSYISENAELVRRMAELAAVTCGVSAEVSFAISRRKRQAYKIMLKEEYARTQMLEAFGYTGLEPNLRINYANFENDCCYSAFLRGAFLAAGSVSDPEKEYHFEIVPQYKMLSGDLLRLIGEAEAISLTPLQTSRKGSEIVYIKDSAQIEDILTYIGATNASMEIMQVKMYKEARNNINRQSNFETANMDKTFSASAKQIAAIALINDVKGLDFLDDDLALLAEKRLHNPEMTLRELAIELNITRNSLNYKMKKILDIAKRIEAEKGGIEI